MKRLALTALVGWAGIMALGWYLADGRARHCPDTYNCAANELGTRDAFLIAGLLVPFLVAVLLAILNARRGAPLIDRPTGTNGPLLTHNKPKSAYRRSVPWRLIIPAEPRARAAILLTLVFALYLLAVAISQDGGAATALDAARPGTSEASDPVEAGGWRDKVTPVAQAETADNLPPLPPGYVLDAKVSKAAPAETSGAMPRNITVTFADGSTHVYLGAPDNISPDQVSARAAKEFGKPVKSLDGGRSQQALPAPPPGFKLDPQPEKQSIPPLPPGFKLDTPATIAVPRSVRAREAKPDQSRLRARLQPAAAPTVDAGVPAALRKRNASERMAERVGEI